MTTQASQSEVASAPYIPLVIGNLNATAGMTLTLNAPPALQGPGTAKTKLVQSADCAVSIVSELRQNGTSITLFARASADMSSMYYVKLSNTVAGVCCCGSTVDYCTTVVTLYKKTGGVSLTLGAFSLNPSLQWTVPLSKLLSISAVGSRISVSFSGDINTGQPVPYGTYLTYLDPNPLPAGFSGAAQDAPAGAGSLTGLAFADIPGDSIALGFASLNVELGSASEQLILAAECAERESAQGIDAASDQFVAQVQGSETAMLTDNVRDTPVFYANQTDVVGMQVAFWS
jgi:hypothetical protein